MARSGMTKEWDAEMDTDMEIVLMDQLLWMTKHMEVATRKTMEYSHDTGVNGNRSWKKMESTQLF